MLSPGHTLQGARRPALLLRASREMCILAVASGVHPGFPLVVVHNREELAARPASPCQRWPGSVVCAKDLLSNGTWMGLNEKLGVFCSLTNMRHPGGARPDASSRGLLVNAVLHDGTEVGSMGALRSVATARDFDGFNACVGRPYPTRSGVPPSVFRVSNTPPSLQQRQPSLQQRQPAEEWQTDVVALDPGVVHCWSNNAPGAPQEWPKVRWLQRELSRVLAQGPGAVASAAAAAAAAPAVAYDAAKGDDDSECEGGTPLDSLPIAVRSLLEELSDVISTTVPFSDAELPKDLESFSDVGPWRESHLQRGPFVTLAPEIWPEYGGCARHPSPESRDQPTACPVHVHWLICSR